MKRVLDLGITRIGVRWNVNAEEMRSQGECEPDDATPDGLWDVDTDTIFIRTGLSRKRKYEVFFHELGHAVLDYYDAAARGEV